MSHFIQTIKQFFFLFVLLNYFACSTTKLPVENLGDNWEPGKCYFSVKVDTDDKSRGHSSGFVLTITEPEFKEILFELSPTDLKKYNQSDGGVHFPIRNVHLKFTNREKDLFRFVHQKDQMGYLFCRVEVAGHYRFYELDSLKKMNFLIPIQKLVKPAKIEKQYFRKKPKKLLANQYYFEEGHWTLLKEAIASSSCGGYTVRQIEKKLVALGYDIPINNIMEEHDKEALIHFQNKNGLKQGQLDFETLKKLGIKF